ncbi:unnamed protein product, partial [Strongylus vulgaris]
FRNFHSLCDTFRSHIPTKVNCWFCQHDQRVPYDQRNSFICSSCEQYNGFDASGGYNRKVPGQQCVVAAKLETRYCTPSKTAFTRPDVVPKEGYGSNGLCDQCNRQQEIIMKKIADFEPLNEDRWNEELDDYRYKLNKIYPLCSSCTFYAQKKMQEEKVSSDLEDDKDGIRTPCIECNCKHFTSQITKKA